MRTLPYMLMAAAIGVAVALQGVLNARLRAHWSLATAILLNAAVGLALALGMWWLSGRPLPSRAQWEHVSWPLLLGGVLGFYIITAGAVVFGRLSATVALALVLLGQFATALLVDANGWFGMPRVAIGPERLLGLALLAAGVLLLRR